MMTLVYLRRLLSLIIRHGQWRWPWAGTPELRTIKMNIMAHPPPQIQEQDDVKWVLHSSGKFSIKSAWESIHTRKEQVGWHNLIWYPHRIPKTSFCLWLAIQGRLGTQDRGFFADPQMKCLLCECHLENHTHLFFECAISDQLCKLIQLRCGFAVPSLSWNNLVSWITQKWKGNNLCMDIWRLSLAGTVYQIWSERNFRLHNNRANNLTHIYESIIGMVRLKLSSLKGIQDSADNRCLQLQWNLPASIFS